MGRSCLHRSIRYLYQTFVKLFLYTTATYRNEFRYFELSSPRNRVTYQIIYYDISDLPMTRYDVSSLVLTHPALIPAMLRCSDNPCPVLSLSVSDVAIVPRIVIQSFFYSLSERFNFDRNIRMRSNTFLKLTNPSDSYLQIFFHVWSTLLERWSSVESNSVTYRSKAKLSRILSEWKRGILLTKRTDEAGQTLDDESAGSQSRR